MRGRHMYPPEQEQDVLWNKVTFHYVPTKEGEKNLSPDAIVLGLMDLFSTDAIDGLTVVPEPEGANMDDEIINLADPNPNPNLKAQRFRDIPANDKPAHLMAMLVFAIIAVVLVALVGKGLWWLVTL